MPLTPLVASRAALKAQHPLDPKQSNPANTDTMELDPETQKLKTPVPYEQSGSLKDVLKEPKPWSESGYQTSTPENSMARMLTPSFGHLAGTGTSALKSDMSAADLEKAGKLNPEQGEKKKQAKKEDAEGVARMVLFLFHARTLAHLLHLQTKSFAKHIALDELYEALPGLVDAYIEAYQGIYGVVPSYPLTEVPDFMVSDVEAFIAALQAWFKSARAATPADSELQNSLDEIATQIDSTKYKLENLS